MELGLVLDEQSFFCYGQRDDKVNSPDPFNAALSARDVDNFIRKIGLTNVVTNEKICVEEGRFSSSILLMVTVEENRYGATLS